MKHLVLKINQLKVAYRIVLFVCSSIGKKLNAPLKNVRKRPFLRTAQFYKALEYICTCILLENLECALEVSSKTSHTQSRMLRKVFFLFVLCTLK